MACLLHGLARDGDIEKGIIITDDIRNTIKKYRYKINFDQPEKTFPSDENIQALFKELKQTLPTPSQARNHLRRTIHGIRKMTENVKMIRKIIGGVFFVP